MDRVVGVNSGEEASSMDKEEEAADGGVGLQGALGQLSMPPRAMARQGKFPEGDVLRGDGCVSMHVY